MSTDRPIDCTAHPPIPPARRGQAWIVYDDVGAATTALRSLQGFTFLGKPLVRTHVDVHTHTHTWARLAAV